MSEDIKRTYFSDVYESFLSKITDDMYMELTIEETNAILQSLLITAIPKFEFPRKILDYVIESEDSGYFNDELSAEELNILSTYMIVEWIGVQVASVEQTRMKYSGSDFKFTSQANHLAKLLALKQDYEREGFHLQRVYKRRKPNSKGILKTTMVDLMKPLEDADFE